MLPDWDHFYVLMKAMLHRVPCLLDAYLEKLTNAPEPFSPDGQWILGKAPEVWNGIEEAQQHLKHQCRQSSSKNVYARLHTK